MRKNCDLFNYELLRKHEMLEAKGLLADEAVSISKLNPSLLPKELMEAAKAIREFEANKTRDRDNETWNKQMEIEKKMFAFLREGDI